MSEQQLFNTIIAFFEEEEWDFQWLDDTSMLSMHFSGKNGTWLCYAQVRESQQQFIYYSLLPVNAPEERRAALAEFITRANYGMIIGNFEMDFDTGEIRYKTSIDVEDAELTAPMIRHLVYSNLVITDHYLPGIMRVIYGDVAPVEALAMVEQDALRDMEHSELLDLLDDDVDLDDELLGDDVDLNDELLEGDDDDDLDDEALLELLDDEDDLMGLLDDEDDEDESHDGAGGDENPFDDEPPSDNGQTPH